MYKTHIQKIQTKNQISITGIDSLEREHMYVQEVDISSKLNVIKRQMKSVVGEGLNFKTELTRAEMKTYRLPTSIERGRKKFSEMSFVLK